MAVPSTTSEIGTRLTALQTELAELVVGCRTLGDKSSQGKAARELGHELAVARKYFDPQAKPQFATLKARL
jgi:hypothetical protein